MSYLKDFEAELRKKLDEMSDKEAFIKWVCDRVFHSFRNGVVTGRKDQPSTNSPSQAQ